ncbi:hypothetical protein HYH02_000499 [Chlamydomonas schloesseri]|uniref:Uncharacterized protein n=1 Tax=Chlamydomonas schloesseri TaxID=2026947 RepID=A0A836B210_9CHLO|nr:hypothetical protein HYH02_015497 [Chlamydomonas schloesseri]KAG2445028.1 hypothetical protein HYH02_008896 [Chlamydomonas schloesseri]KAG2451067.1 hypothetical protein HYH02_004335 [Chlamydomonas schloesseri]KAG2452051.1 hypothetical protein HYH02_003087 [Chlamydomonas schloesseri]KAG2452052.1 hypothetical protein HYH02_003088 [Chlamydomonas schloesseri]|eukprot:KAG2422146.1 hypothetical protein HYH02_015497 [Chlamydomonas schloesseri]
MALQRYPTPPPGGRYMYSPPPEYPIYPSYDPVTGKVTVLSFGMGNYADLNALMAPGEGATRGHLQPTHLDAELLEEKVRSEWRGLGPHMMQFHYYIRIVQWSLQRRGFGTLEYLSGRYGQPGPYAVVVVQYKLGSGGAEFRHPDGRWVSPDKWGDGGPGDTLVRLARHLPSAHAAAAVRATRSFSPPDSRRRHNQRDE